MQIQSQMRLYNTIERKITMRNENKIYVTAEELSKMLGISIGNAYRIIRGMNQELQNEGYLVIAGKVPRRYFEKRWYGYGT